MGVCVTTETTPSAPGTSCNVTTATNACDCFADTGTELGFCVDYCEVGGAACASGYQCDAELPPSLVNSSGTTVTGWTTQNSGLGGICTPTCVVGGTASLPTNSTCQDATAAAPTASPDPA